MAFREVVVQGNAVRVAVAGVGPPALFLHGVPDSSAIWDTVVAGVSDRFTCYAPDFMGMGGSAFNPDFDFSFDGYARWVDELMDALGISEPVTLVAHDWGGIMGMLWACSHPNRIGRLVMMSAPFTSSYRWHFWARIWRTPHLGELSMKLINPLIMRSELRRGSRKLTSAQIDHVVLTALTVPTARQVILRLYRSADPKNWDEWQPLVAGLSEVKTTVLWGERDVYLPHSLIGALEPDDVKIIEGVGHWVPTEAPQSVIDELTAPTIRRHNPA